MKKEVKHCFSQNRCDMIIDLYRNFEALRLKVARQCDNDCIGFMDAVKKDIYKITLPELEEYFKIVCLRRNIKLPKKI